MEIVVLDAATLGADTDLSPLNDLGTVTVWDNTPAELVSERIKDTEVIVSNKVKEKRAMKRILEVDDEHIINFM